MKLKYLILILLLTKKASAQEYLKPNVDRITKDFVKVENVKVTETETIVQLNFTNPVGKREGFNNDFGL